MVELNVLFSSDGIQRITGFATVARNTCFHLKDLGFNIYSQDWNMQHGKTELYGIPILAGGKHIENDPRTHHGYRTIRDYINRYDINALIMLGDIDMTWYLIKKKTKCKQFYYLPIDTDYLPTNYVEVIKQMEIPVAMSDFGKQTMINCGADNVEHTIYHGIDPKIFNRDGKRLQDVNIKTNKNESVSNWSDKFVVVNVDTNTPRKRQAELIHAWSIFSKDKDDVLLYMHTDPKTINSGGRGFFNLNEIAYYHNVNPKDKKIFFPDWTQVDKFTDQYLAVVYRSADVFASASTGEGYGLTKHEAMACGVPCITPNYAASVEMVDGRGLLCETAKWKNGDTIKQFDVHSQLRVTADVYDLAEKLQIYYDNRKLLKEHSEKAYKWAQSRTWETETKKWAKLIESCCS